MPRSGPLFQRLLFELPPLSFHSPFRSPFFSSLSPLLSIPLSASHPTVPLFTGQPVWLFNHPFQLQASCKRPLALSWGSPTSTVCSFPNPLYRCRILIAPQSTNLILCQPLQRRHVVSRDRATWLNNLHERWERKCPKMGVYKLPSSKP